MTRFPRIQASVPAGVELPDTLRRIFDYLDDTDYPISGCMRLRPDDCAGLLAWFDGAQPWLPTSPASAPAPMDR